MFISHATMRSVLAVASKRDRIRFRIEGDGDSPLQNR